MTRFSVAERRHACGSRPLIGLGHAVASVCGRGGEKPDAGGLADVGATQSQRLYPRGGGLVPQSLVELVYDATRGNPAQRMPSIGDFRARLDRVWDELTAPEPEPVIDPLTAQRGDVLDGGLRVVRRLGSGATATALKVTLETPDGTRDNLVLKVARDDQHAERFAAEARVLRQLHHWQIAALVAETSVAGRPALLLESAGETTLAQDLLGGRLALEMLDRYGRDLLDLVVFLDSTFPWPRRPPIS